MIYLDGQNNLEPYLLNNFEKMSSVGLASGVNIVVELGRLGGTQDSDYGGWTGVREGLVNEGDTPTGNWGTEVAGNPDMGAPSTLGGFLTWAKKDYPAQNYALILCDHGGGFQGVCQGTSGGVITPAALTTALAAAGMTNISLLGFDACLMGMTEVAYQLRNSADVMVASEAYTPASDWDYADFLDDLEANPGMSAADLGSWIVTTYDLSYGSSWQTTLSCINLCAMPDLAAAINNFTAMTLSLGQDSDWEAVQERGTWRSITTITLTAYQRQPSPTTTTATWATS